MILVKRRKKESDNIAKNLLATRFELQNPQYDNNKSWFVCYIIYKSLLRTRHLWIINYAFWIYRVVRGLSRWCIPICMLPNFKGQISPIKSRYHINLKARCCFEMVITYDAQGSTRHPSYQSTQSYSKYILLAQNCKLIPWKTLIYCFWRAYFSCYLLERQLHLRLQVIRIWSKLECEMTFPERISLSIIALQYYSKSRILHDNPLGTHSSGLISRHFTQ